MTRRVERTSGAIVIALLLGLLACREADPPPHRLLFEDFEEACGETPCGWSQIAGEPGQARWAETFHPGEHALVLEGAGVVARGPGGEPKSANFVLGSLEVRAVARCDPGNALAFRLAVRFEDSGRTDVLEGRLTAPSEWGPVAPVLVSSDAALDGGAGGGFPVGRDVRAVGITVGKTGSGRCEIGRLIVDGVGTTGRDVSEGC